MLRVELIFVAVDVIFDFGATGQAISLIISLTLIGHLTVKAKTSGSITQKFRFRIRAKVIPWRAAADFIALLQLPAKFASLGCVISKNNPSVKRTTTTSTTTTRMVVSSEAVATYRQLDSNL